ncbi:hypothetical protein BH09BAC6_BH09BAC6_06510 [soil metagenome]|jgi:hypothetical protein
MSVHKNGQVLPEVVPSRLTKNNKTIGIWKPEYVNGEVSYKIDPKFSNSMHFWASVNTIPAKSDKKRIVFLGESVARGYLFDPYFNPAMALEKLLNGSELIDAEVIDLAKVSIEIEELTKLTTDSIGFDPDAIVVFAGNNWFSSFRNNLTSNSAVEIDKIVNQYSSVEADGSKCLNNQVFKQIKIYIESKLAEITVNYINCLTEISKTNNVPVVFIIPEFNLLDWKSTEAERILLRLSDADLNNWLNAKQTAETAVANNDLESLAVAAGKMVEIDWSHPLGYELLAKYYKETGNYDDARNCLENARDTSMFCRSSGQARVYKIIQDTLVEEAKKNDITIINLPEIFKKHLNGALPGRNLFIDYCHLNIEGINISMGKTAHKLLEIFKASPVDENKIDLSVINVDKNVRAVAYLCAAVHNSHYGQTSEIVDYLCKQAFSSLDVIVDLVKRYADMATRKISTVLCKSHDEIVESEAILQYQRGVGFISKTNNKLLDIDLVDTIVKELKAIGVDIEDEVTSLRIKEHGITSRGVDLLQSCYKTSSYEEYCGNDVPYLRSRNVTTGFFVVAGETTTAKVKITYRTPSAGDENIKVLLNDNVIESLPSSKRWKSAEFAVENGLFKKGINHLTICWPHQNPGNSSVNDCTNDASVIEKLSLVFGEIHMLKVLSN